MFVSGHVSAPGPGNAQIEPSGNCFAHFYVHGRKMLKFSFWGLILSIYRADPENAQIVTTGTGKKEDLAFQTGRGRW